MFNRLFKKEEALAKKAKADKKRAELVEKENRYYINLAWKNIKEHLNAGSTKFAPYSIYVPRSRPDFTDSKRALEQHKQELIAAGYEITIEQGFFVVK